MITNDPRVVFQIVKKVDHQLAFAAQADLSALINVAHIDQDRVPILLPPAAYLRHTTRQSAEVRISAVIDRRQNVAVQISRVQDRDGNRAGIERLGCPGK